LLVIPVSIRHLLTAACINSWLLKWSVKNICSFWKRSRKGLKDIEVCSRVKWCSSFLAAAENIWVIRRYWLNGECCGGGGARLCLGCAFWQVMLQECVNDTDDVWSSFLYIPCSSQYIQHIECRVRIWMEYFMCLCSVWKHIVHYWSEHYCCLDTVSRFCILWPTLSHQYIILKGGEMQYYIYIHYLVYFVVSQYLLCLLQYEIENVFCRSWLL